MKGEIVKHIVNGPVEVGKEVEVVLDWKRRLDHMQQHSAQHLISGIANTRFKWDDASWNLGIILNIHFDL